MDPEVKIESVEDDEDEFDTQPVKRNKHANFQAEEEIIDYEPEDLTMELGIADAKQHAFKIQRMVEPGVDHSSLSQTTSNYSQVIQSIQLMCVYKRMMREQQRIKLLGTSDEELLSSLTKLVVTDDEMKEEQKIGREDNATVEALHRHDEAIQQPWTHFTQILKGGLSKEAFDLFGSEKAISRRAHAFIIEQATQELLYISELAPARRYACPDTMKHLRGLLEPEAAKVPPFGIEMYCEEADFAPQYLPDNETFVALQNASLIHLPTNSNGYTLIGPASWKSSYAISKVMRYPLLCIENGQTYRAEDEEPGALEERAKWMDFSHNPVYFQFNEEEMMKDPDYAERIRKIDEMENYKGGTIDITDRVAPIDPTPIIMRMLGYDVPEEVPMIEECAHFPEEPIDPATMLSDDLLYLKP